MPIPNYEELMPILLKHASEERKFREAVNFLSDHLGLTEEERSERIPSGTDTVIANRTAWAITYMVQAGRLERPKRGFFVITEEGQKVLANDLNKLNAAFLMRYKSFVEFSTRSKSLDREKIKDGVLVSEVDSDLTPEEKIGRAYKEIETDLKNQIILRLLRNSPQFFEESVVTLLSALGYGNSRTLSKVIGKPGDGGIDGIIHQDHLGLDAVYIQAKKYALENKVSRPELQAFVGTLIGESATKGVFVTTSDYTQGAKDYLKTVSVRVKTINGNELVDLMIEHGIGVKVKNKIEIYRIDEDFFTED